MCNDCTEAFELCCLEQVRKKKNEVRLISDSSPFIFLLFMGKLLISHRCLSTEAATLCGNGAVAPHLRWLSFTPSTQTVEQALVIARNMRIYFKDQVYDHRVCGKPWTPAAPRAPHRLSVTADQTAVYTSPALGPLGSGSSTKLLKMVLLSPNKTLLASLLLQRVHLCN